jgi:hypothetical protein
MAYILLITRPSYAHPDEKVKSFQLSFKISKADAHISNIPSAVSVAQENVPENPKFCTEVSFVLGKAIRGRLTTRETRTRCYSSDAQTRVVGGGAEVKCFGGNIDFLPSKIKGDGFTEVARNCDRKSNAEWRLNSTTSPRTIVDASAIRGVRTLDTVSEKHKIELVDAFGITNDHSGASVE